MKVVIVGCTHAGVAAAREILRTHPDTDLTIYERNDNVSFLSCDIALYLEGVVNELEDMFYETPEHLESLGAKVRIKHDVLRINPDKKELLVQDMTTDVIIRDSYDKLIMTTGSYVKVPPLKGIDNEKVLLCKGYKQARAIYESAKDKQHIAIVGGGFIDVELAEAYANTDHQVTLVQGNKQLLNNYVDEKMAAKIGQTLSEHNIDVRLGDRVQSFTNIPDSDQVLIETAGDSIAADLAIVCTGFIANTELLFDKVKTTRGGAILTNDYLETSDPDIFAAGDSSAVEYNPVGRPMYIPLASSAIRQGQIAGKNIFGHVLKYPGTQGSTALRFFDHTLANTGLTHNQATAQGIDAGLAHYDGNFRPSFMPTNEEIAIDLVYSRETHKILGAQFFSKYDLTQSANTVSLAIANGNTIEDLAYVDMLFNPHYDQQWNYLNIVAQIAMQQEESPA